MLSQRLGTVAKHRITLFAGLFSKHIDVSLSKISPGSFSQLMMVYNALNVSYILEFSYCQPRINKQDNLLLCVLGHVIEKTFATICQVTSVH